MSRYEDAKRINSAIQNSNSAWGNSRFLNQKTSMRGDISSQIAYAIGETPIDYATAIVDDDRKFVHVVVFAGGRIAWLTNTDQSAEISTSVFSVNQIEGVELIQVPNVVGGGFTDSAPLSLVVRLEDKTLVLPGDRNATSRNTDQLEALLPRLLELFAPIAV